MPFTPETFYPNQLPTLHQKRFTPKIPTLEDLYSESPVHHKPFTPEGFYTQNAFTPPISQYPPILLCQQPMPFTRKTPEALHTNQLLHQQTFQIHKFDSPNNEQHKQPWIAKHNTTTPIQQHPGMQHATRVH